MIYKTHKAIRAVELEVRRRLFFYQRKGGGMLKVIDGKYDVYFLGCRAIIENKSMTLYKDGKNKRIAMKVMSAQDKYNMNRVIALLDRIYREAI